MFVYFGFLVITLHRRKYVHKNVSATNQFFIDIKKIKLENSIQLRENVRKFYDKRHLYTVY